MINQHISEALKILEALGLPRAQKNERSALCLLALINLTPKKSWRESENPLVGITPMMDFSRKNYQKSYAPNTRETFRRQTMHQFVAAGIALYNPDDCTRAVNSPKAVYQIESETLELLKKYGTNEWDENLKLYLSKRKTLTIRYAKERELNKIAIQVAEENAIYLSSGNHNELIKAIVEKFIPCFATKGVLVYIGDTGNKWSYFNETLLIELGIKLDTHGKMPDVIVYLPEKKWLFLIESVTSHGPIDGKRYEELMKLFSTSLFDLVYVTAFPSRSIMAKYIPEIAWETEVWLADSPSHLIHFNGSKFLGPY